MVSRLDRLTRDLPNTLAGGALVSVPAIETRGIRLMNVPLSSSYPVTGRAVQAVIPCEDDSLTMKSLVPATWEMLPNRP